MSKNLFNYFKRGSSLPCPSGPPSKTVPSAMIQAANDSVLSVISTAEGSSEGSAPECSDGKKCALTLSCRQKIKRFPSKRRTCTYLFLHVLPSTCYYSEKLDSRNILEFTKFLILDRIQEVTKVLYLESYTVLKRQQGRFPLIFWVLKPGGGF